MTPRRTQKAPRRSATAESTFAVLSIGALSRATGVPVETLRTWERRYEFPRPAPRDGSGHRRYPIDAVDRLRLVVRALESGHAPSVVLRAAPEVLRQLLSLTGAQPPSAPSPGKDGSFEDRCTEHVLRLNGEGLVAELERAWNDSGGLECVIGRVGPFLDALGQGWSEGQVEVGHEHFASEHVREFLIGHWRPMSERSAGPRVVCATVGGELHVLGLHMAATALALAGVRVVFLGATTPPADIVRTVKQQRAVAVALSAARGTPEKSLAADVGKIRRALPQNVVIVVGGAGFGKPPAGVLAKPDLRELTAWARTLAAAAAPVPQ